MFVKDDMLHEFVHMIYKVMNRFFDFILQTSTAVNVWDQIR